MATQYPRLVNKQFNTPIKLYSPQNIQEVLDRETQILANGAVGIDFHQLSKPANLKNSAVLRMLEEEENRKKSGQPSLKQVIWPPPPDSEEYSNLVEEAPVYAQGGPQYHSQQPSPVQQQQQSPRPATVSPSYQQQQQQQQQQQRPQQQSQSPQSFAQQQSKGWAPVHSSVAGQRSPQAQQQQPQPQPPQQVYRPPAPVVEPPPALITLRPEAPISQAPAPVYSSQPATATLRGGDNMRGDMKWPPATVKARMENDNEMRRQLAKGPACRPRKVRKDYTSFFAQHALNSTYPGYRAPPGTQYYLAEQSGVTNF